jgi:hypothetical protein
MAYILNGQSYDFAVPMLIDGTTFVPLGNVADALGGIVDWDNMTKTATVEFGDQKVRVQADNPSVETSAGMESLQAAPFIDSSTLWIPVRFFQQILNCNIAVDGDNIQITRNF